MRLGKYELHEVIGKGGYGAVYRATDLSLEREVAVKVLHPQLTVDNDFVERFRREARLMAKLEHVNIVPVYELGEIEGRFVIVMKLLKSGSLADLIQHGALPYPRAVEILRDVCAGLQTAHQLGWVHRDIKPGNILLDEDGRALLSDFGLARSVETSGSSSGLGGAGTPFYRAPELWLGAPPASPATDVYSLGCILYEIMAGKVLFGGATPDQVIARHLVIGPDLGSGWLTEGVPAGVSDVVARSLDRDPAKRYLDAATFFKALSLLEIKPISPTAIPAQQSAKGENERDLVEENNRQALEAKQQEETAPQAEKEKQAKLAAGEKISQEANEKSQIDPEGQRKQNQVVRQLDFPVEIPSPRTQTTGSLVQPKPLENKPSKRSRTGMMVGIGLGGGSLLIICLVIGLFAILPKLLGGIASNSQPPATQPSSTLDNTATPASQAMAIYTNDKVGISLNYPFGWVTNELSSDVNQGEVVFTSSSEVFKALSMPPERVNEPTPTPYVIQGAFGLIVRLPYIDMNLPNSVNPRSPTDVLPYALSIFEQELGIIISNNEKPVNEIVSSYHATKLIILINSFGQMLFNQAAPIEMVVIATQNGVIEILCSSPENRWNQDQPIFEQMINSLQIVDDNSSPQAATTAPSAIPIEAPTTAPSAVPASSATTAPTTAP